MRDGARNNGREEKGTRRVSSEEGCKGATDGRWTEMSRMAQFGSRSHVKYDGHRWWVATSGIGLRIRMQPIPFKSGCQALGESEQTCQRGGCLFQGLGFCLFSTSTF